tara:strand:+ start:150 stop:881 length:732 start_codon:yes stop_codon:yes gene_type:complete
MKIIGIAGKKQSGKNTTANILHGLVLKQRNMIKDFNIDANGKLLVLTTNTNGEEGWGEFDVTRNDEDFVSYAEHSMWPYVKLYSFADHLKWICVKLFNIPRECVFGTDEQKNQKQKHLAWEKMPGHITTKQGYGPMTAREFMQYFGTDIMRKIYEPIWVESCINLMDKEQSELAIISDVRFENEVKAIESAGGKVIRLTRQICEDEHDSEKALDNYKFSDYIDNANISIDEMMSKIKNFYQSM